MKSITCAIIALLTYSFTYAQTKIELKDVANHIGDRVEVQGTIFGIRFLENAKGSPTLINVGAAYPDQLLTIVIFGDVRKQLKISLDEKTAKGNIAWVTGVPQLYKDKPQIVISDPKQLDILMNTHVNTN